MKEYIRFNNLLAEIGIVVVLNWEISENNKKISHVTYMDRVSQIDAIVQVYKKGFDVYYRSKEIVLSEEVNRIKESLKATK